MLSCRAETLFVAPAVVQRMSWLFATAFRMVIATLAVHVIRHVTYTIGLHYLMHSGTQLVWCSSPAPRFTAEVIVDGC